MIPEKLDELYDYLLQQKRNGMSFSEIRRLLKEKQLDEETIAVIIRNIDKQVLRDEGLKHQRQKARELIGIGLFIVAAGLVVTVGTYTGFIKMGHSFMLAHGPVLGGLGVFFAGLGKYRKLGK